MRRPTDCIRIFPGGEGAVAGAALRGRCLHAGAKELLHHLVGKLPSQRRQLQLDLQRLLRRAQQSSSPEQCGDLLTQALHDGIDLCCRVSGVFGHLTLHS